jgi:hypothetical protein
MLWKDKSLNFNLCVLSYSSYEHCPFDYNCLTLSLALFCELQVVGRIAMVEEFLRPMKPALAQMQVDCSDLGELVKKLQIQADQHERQLNARLNMDEVPVGAEYEAEAIDVLNASLESGEIDIDQYATSLRIALNSEARKDSPNHPQNASYDLDSPVQTSHTRPVPHLSHHAPQPNFRPTMIPNTSTPPPHQLVKKMPLSSSVPSSTFVQPHYAPQAASKPFVRQLDTRAVVDSAVVKAAVVEVESPIPVRKDAVLPTATRSTPAPAPQFTPKDQPTSHQLPTSGSFSTQKMRAIEIPAQTENKNPLANSLTSLTSTSIQSRKKTLADVPSSLADSDNIFQMMEPIMKEERENVKFWLGMDMPELNRAISIMNEFATTQRFEMTSFKEFYITVDDVAAQCNLDAKKAKAAVLLLCNFKRLKLVRGEINSYSLLSGTTLVK